TLFRSDRSQLRTADLDDVVVTDADVGDGVAVAAGPAGRPHLVVDLAERVDAGDLVAVAVADEDVLHGGHPQQVDVLADVGGVERHPHRGQVHVHQVHPSGHADDRDRGGGQLLQYHPLAQDDQRTRVQLLHGLQPHVDLVGGVLGTGEVEHRLGPVLAQPAVEGLEHPVGGRRDPAAPEVRHQDQHVEGAQDHRYGDAHEADEGRVEGGGHQYAHDRSEVE